MTQAGLNPVNLSSLSTFQQVIIFALIIVGNQGFVSVVVVGVRKRAFERAFVERDREKRGAAETTGPLMVALPVLRGESTA